VSVVILVLVLFAALALFSCWPLLPVREIKPQLLAFVDVETTGLKAGYHELLEIAVVVVIAPSMHVVGELCVKVLPEHMDRAHPKALEVNGYTPEAWCDAAPLHVALEMLSPLLQGALMVGHNVSFDKGFITAAYEQCGMKYPKADYHTLDTVSLAWPLKVKGKVKNLKLHTLCDYFGISNEGEHAALADVLRTIKVYLSLVG